MSFEEDFPSLMKQLIRDDRVICILKQEVERHCIDKQKVREAIEKKIDECYSDDEDIMPDTKTADMFRDLKKELGI